MMCMTSVAPYLARSGVLLLQNLSDTLAKHALLNSAIAKPSYFVSCTYEAKSAKSQARIALNYICLTSEDLSLSPAASEAESSVLRF